MKNLFLTRANNSGTRRPISGFNVRVSNKIEDIGKDPLDSISNDPFFTYGWFKTLEVSKPSKSHFLYLTVFYENSLVGFLPCSLDLASEYFVNRPYLPFMKRILRVGNSLNICRDFVLMCYSPFCWRSKILFKDNSDRELIVELLSRKIEDICRKEKILFSSFEYISERDDFLISNLQNHGYLKFPWRGNTLYLPIDWLTFKDYLSSLTQNGRKAVRRDIKKCVENGVELFEAPDFEKLSEKLSSFYSNLFNKYNKGQKSPYTPYFFEVLSKYSKEKVKVFVARKEGKLVGFSLLMRHRQIVDAFLTGYDYSSQTPTDYTYFNLVFYEPIKWAIKTQAERINYRIGAEEAKLRRGCKEERVFSLVKCHNNNINFIFSAYAIQKNRFLFKKSGINIADKH